MLVCISFCSPSTDSPRVYVALQRVRNTSLTMTGSGVSCGSGSCSQGGQSLWAEGWNEGVHKPAGRNGKEGQGIGWSSNQLYLTA